MVDPRSAGERGAESAVPENGALEATGAYEAGDGLVLYDTERPLAWVESDSAVSLDEMA